MGPLVRCVHNELESVVLSVFHDRGSHLVQNAPENLFPLGLPVLLEILDGAIKGLLLGLNLLDESGLGLLVELVALGLQLFLQTFKLLILGLEFVLLGLQFLGQGIGVTAA